MGRSKQSLNHMQHVKRLEREIRQLLAERAAFEQTLVPELEVKHMRMRVLCAATAKYMSGDPLPDHFAVALHEFVRTEHERDARRDGADFLAGVPDRVGVLLPVEGPRGAGVSLPAAAWLNHWYLITSTPTWNERVMASRDWATQRIKQAWERVTSRRTPDEQETP